MNQPLRSAIATGAVGPGDLVRGLGCAPLGRGQDAGGEPAGSTDLLRAAPFDRVTLIDGTDLIVEPVSPRPLPAIDPSKDSKRRGRDRKPVIPPEGNIFVGRADQDRAARQRQGGRPGRRGQRRGQASSAARGGPTRYAITRSSVRTSRKSSISRICCLQECDRLVTVHDYARAFECCLRVQTRNPGWPGLDDHVNRVLFAEGSTRLDRRRRRARASGCWASCWGGSVITPACSTRSAGPTRNGSSGP